MNKKLILCAAFLVAAVADTFACTNLIVGKNASADGRPSFPILPIHMGCLESYIIIRPLLIRKEPCWMYMSGIPENILEK